MKHAHLVTGLAAALPLIAACYEGGFRAETGQCPPGETCSDATPYGLRFQGSPLSDRIFDTTVHPTAVGGSQRLTVHEADEWGSSDVFSRPFEATTQYGDFEIVAAAPPDVDIRAKADGADYVRIISAATGELYDKLAVTSLPVDDLRIVPKGEVVALESDEPWAFLVRRDDDVPREVRIELFAADGQRLIDTSMVVAIDGASIEDRETWDVVAFEALEPSEVEVSATAGDGITATTDVVFVDAIDAIAPEGQPSDFVLVDDLTVVCMRAEASGLAVAGVDWTFSSRGPIELYRDDLGLLGGRNCVTVAGVAVGLGTVVVEAHGLSLEIPLEVRPASRAGAQPGAIESSPPSPGERARRVRRAADASRALRRAPGA